MNIYGTWKWYSYSLEPNLSENGLTVGSDGRVWVNVISEDSHIGNSGKLISGSHTDSILVLNQEQWTLYPLNEIGLAGTLSVVKMACDSSGNLWLYLIPKTLCRFDGRTTKIFRAGEKGLPDDLGLVSNLAGDKAGNLWIAMSSIGICRFAEDTWERLSPGDISLDGNFVTSMTIDHFGQVWLAITNPDHTSFLRYVRNKWEVHDRLSVGLSQGQVEGLAIDKKGGLWVGWAGDPSGKHRPQLWALRRQGEAWEKYTARSPALRNIVYMNNIVVDNANRIWLGSGIGIGIIDGMESINWEVMIPDVRHGPLTQKAAARAQQDGDKRTYTLIGGYVAIDSTGSIWSTTRGKGNWGLCVFSEVYDH